MFFCAWARRGFRQELFHQPTEFLGLSTPKAQVHVTNDAFAIDQVRRRHALDAEVLRTPSTRVISHREVRRVLREKVLCVFWSFIQVDT